MDEKELEQVSTQTQENETTETSNETEHQEVLSSNKPKKTTFFVEGSIYSFFAVFGIVFLSCLLVFQIILSPIMVVGKSMQPTINISVESDTDDEHCDIVYYRQSDAYDNDDIVIVANLQQQYVSRKDVKYFIKRIIACPGQTITFFLTDEKKSGYVTTYYYDVMVKDESGNVIDINDSFLDEEMSFTSTDLAFGPSAWFKTIFSNLANPTLSQDERKYELTLSGNKYFVMGDNRGNSEDSRFFGAVIYDDIEGEMKIHVPYGKSVFYGVWQYIKSLF